MNDYLTNEEVECGKGKSTVVPKSCFLREVQNRWQTGSWSMEII
jgi:hypothetical protein